MTPFPFFKKPKRATCTWHGRGKSASQSLWTSPWKGDEKPHGFVKPQNLGKTTTCPLGKNGAIYDISAPEKADGGLAFQDQTCPSLVTDILHIIKWYPAMSQWFFGSFSPFGGICYTPWNRPIAMEFLNLMLMVFSARKMRTFHCELLVYHRVGIHHGSPCHQAAQHWIAPQHMGMGSNQPGIG